MSITIEIKQLKEELSLYNLQLVHANCDEGKIIVRRKLETDNPMLKCSSCGLEIELREDIAGGDARKNFIFTAIDAQTRTFDEGSVCLQIEKGGLPVKSSVFLKTSP